MPLKNCLSTVLLSSADKKALLRRFVVSIRIDKRLSARCTADNIYPLQNSSPRPPGRALHCSDGAERTEPEPELQRERHYRRGEVGWAAARVLERAASAGVAPETHEHSLPLATKRSAGAAKAHISKKSKRKKKKCLCWCLLLGAFLGWCWEGVRRSLLPTWDCATWLVFLPNATFALPDLQVAGCGLVVECRVFRRQCLCLVLFLVFKRRSLPSASRFGGFGLSCSARAAVFHAGDVGVSLDLGPDSSLSATLRSWRAAAAAAAVFLNALTVENVAADLHFVAKGGLSQALLHAIRSEINSYAERHLTLLVGANGNAFGAGSGSAGHAAHAQLWPFSRLASILTRLMWATV